MGRIIAKVNIANALDPKHQMDIEALVDTGTSGMVLPKEWKSKLGNMPFCSQVEMETADQRMIKGEVCGPVQIQITGFRPVSSEVTFMEMESKEGQVEPLLGYIILEQSMAAVDMLGHRLTHVKYMDLK